MIIVTGHAKTRTQERVSKSYRSRKLNGYYSRMQKNGKRTDDFEGEFYQYLKKKECHCRKYDTVCYVYEENIFVNTGGKIVTTYPVPEEFRPVSQYLKIPKQEKSQENQSMKTMNSLIDLIVNRLSEDYFLNFFSLGEIDILYQKYKNDIKDNQYIGYRKDLCMTEKRFKNHIKKLRKHLRMQYNFYLNNIGPYSSKYQSTFEIIKNNKNLEEYLDEKMRIRAEEINRSISFNHQND